MSRVQGIEDHQCFIGGQWKSAESGETFDSVDPFGGFKNSGFDRESGQEAINEYLETRCVWMSYGKDVPNPFVMRQSIMRRHRPRRRTIQ